MAKSNPVKIRSEASRRGRSVQAQAKADASNRPTRGSSIQGELQSAKGGPQGANQGGASRGGSRVEPSHVHDQIRKDRALRPAKGGGKAKGGG